MNGFAVRLQFLSLALLVAACVWAEEAAPPAPVPMVPGMAQMTPPKLATVAEIQELMKNFPNVKVAGAGNQVFLDGPVDNPLARERVQKLARTFTNVIDLTTYVENADANEVLAREIEKRIGFADVKVRLIRDAVVLDGEVASEADRKVAENVAKAYAEKVVNNLGLKRQMVEVDLTYYDVSFNKIMSISTNPMTALSNGIAFNGSVGGSPFASFTNTSPSGQPTYVHGWSVSGSAAPVRPWILQWLESDTDNRVLNRPHVTCLTGESASFRQGGEKGYEVINNQTADVKFKEYGLIINVTPNLTRDGRIQLNCYFEFSTPDLGQNASDLDFLKYSTQSVSLLGSGESLIVSGLVKDVTTNFKRGIPFLRRIPLLGHFFDDHSDSKEKRDLVLVITPRLPSTFAAQGPSTAAEQNKRIDPARIRWVEDLGEAERQLKWKSKDRAEAGLDGAVKPVEQPAKK